MFVIFICSFNQKPSSSACTQAVAALYAYKHYNRITKRITEKYLNPLPKKVKMIGAVGATLYKRQIKLPVTKHIMTMYQLNNDNTSTTTLNLNWDFP